MKPFDEKLYKYFALISLISGMIILFLFTIALFKNYNLVFRNFDMQLVGQIGDYIGGTIGTLFSLAATFLLYLTYKTQKTELIQNKKMLQNQELNNSFNSWIELYNNFKNNSKLIIGSNTYQGTSSITKFFNSTKRNELNFEVLKISDPLEKVSFTNSFDLIYITKSSNYHSYLKSWIYMLNVAIDDLNLAKKNGLNVDNKYLLMSSLISWEEIIFLDLFTQITQGSHEAFITNEIKSNFDSFRTLYNSLTRPSIFIH